MDFASAQTYCSGLGMVLAPVNTPDDFAKAFTFYSEISLHFMVLKLL